jgi:S1-C subfamily serine protease
MVRAFIGAVAWLALALPIYGQQPVAPNAKFWADYFRLHSVSVHVTEADGSYMGSGAIVQYAGVVAVVTNNHVVNTGTRSVSVEFADGVKSPCKLIGTGRRDASSEDVSVLIPQRPLVQGAPLGCMDGSEQIWATGFGSGYKIHRGRFLGNASADSGLPYPTVLLSYKPIEGDSGGGIYNAKGEVIGVHWGYDGEHRGLGAVGRPFINIVTQSILNYKQRAGLP